MKRRRSRPQQQRAHEMRDRLLEAANSLLAKDEPVTTRGIAETAHVSIGTVYRYFSDRDEILELLLDAAVRDIANDLTTNVSRALDMPAEDATRLIIETLTAAFERHAPILRATTSGPGSDVDFTADIERMLFPLARVIPARHRTDLSDSELDDLVFVTMGFTATGCLRIALHRPAGSDRQALIDSTAQMIAAGLVPAP